ncbi:MAG: germination protein YpeB, partial [Oscillospiraceae bacterium]|nr:germination protein YpeB [Oscillospiraceae bacterium]
MKKKRLYTIGLLYLSAAVLVFGVLAGTYYERAKRSELTLRYNYEHAFGELVTAVSELDTALEKSVWATSPALVGSLCTEVFGKAMTAQMSLSALPFSAQELEQLSGFISRVGDYAFALSRTAPERGAYSAEELENLRALSGTAGTLSQNLKSLRSDVQDGTLLLLAPERAAETISDAVPEQIGTLSDSLRLIEQEFPEIPSLIYDGPFSEHLSGVAPRALEGEAEIGEEKAREIAAGFLGVGKGRVYALEGSAGDIPCYCFGADEEGGASAYVSVTKCGGRVLSLLSSRPVGSATVDVDTALNTAARFLERCGYENMAETYHMTQGGVLTVNYACRQGEVLCYSDLVKVSVALDSGRVCGLEARGWITAHTQRELPAPTVTA